MAMADPRLPLADGDFADVAVCDRPLHLAPGAGADGRAGRAFRDGPRPGSAFRVRGPVPGELLLAHLLVLDGEQLRALGLPVRVAGELVARPVTAGERLFAAGPRARSPGAQRAGRPDLHAVRDRAGMGADSDRTGSLFGVEPGRLLGPAGGLDESAAGRLLPHADVAPRFRVGL